MSKQPKSKIRFLEAADVSELTSYSAQTVRRLAAAGEFPQSIKIGERRRVWIESEIYEWMRKKVQSGRSS